MRHVEHLGGWLLQNEADLFAARQQMALSLGWHIVIACFGVGFPLLVLIAEWRWIRTGDDIYRLLAHRWSKALAVLFAVGAVTGTILSFEFGILWPVFMERFGEVIGLPFALEGFAFFIEAIFLGIYLYSWDRLPPRVHLLTGVPVVLGGLASAWFVVTANAWMNQPTGFVLEGDEVVSVDPWAAMLNPATPPETTHMIVAAYMVTGFGVAAVYAWGILRGRRGRYHLIGFSLPFALAAILTPIQIGVGDWAARFLADYQPAKLAAIEGLYETQPRAPLTIGGILIDGEIRYGLKIPAGLSLLAEHDPDAVIMGLDQVPEDQHPPVGVVRTAFQIMVAIGMGLLVLSIWFAVAWWRHRRPPRARWFYRAAVAAGFAAAVAVEAGWITTEVGRQPWIVWEVMRVSEAVTDAPNIRYGYYGLLAFYPVLTVATVYVLRRVGSVPLPESEDVRGEDPRLREVRQ
ncbi:MAG TPA: cytochrome ubiquinol oxidase subunit I [Acidimicrobiia bacterium]|nr:cytochrome ubiquinol oxidase subunit I [Acidimicrobiia bacterium]